MNFAWRSNCHRKLLGAPLGTDVALLFSGPPLWAVSFGSGNVTCRGSALWQGVSAFALAERRSETNFAIACVKRPESGIVAFSILAWLCRRESPCPELFRFVSRSAIADQCFSSRFGFKHQCHGRTFRTVARGESGRAFSMDFLARAGQRPAHSLNFGEFV